MNRRRSRSGSALRFAVEALDSRIVLSTAGASAALPGVAEVAGHVAKAAPTTTTLEVHAGTLGQPITFTASVHAASSAGAPTGTVNIVDHGQVVATLALSPGATPDIAFRGPNGRVHTISPTISHGSATLAQPPGGSAYYFGKHAVSAVFVPGGGFAGSAATKAFSVALPSYTPLAGGTKIATIAAGSGPAIQAGQTAKVLYTGYLASNGHIFDSSSKDGGTPLAFTVGAGQVVPGFDAGTAGMQAGETRIIAIPPAQGYGNTASGPIPAHSTLIFVVTLGSIS